MANAHWTDNYADGSNVVKSNLRDGFRDFVPWYGTLAELQATNLGGARIALVRIGNSVHPFYLDGADTTTADDGAFTLVSSSGARYKRTTGARKVLTENLNLYVRTDGNDNNSGLANTAAGAFRTIQKAVYVACGLYDAGTNPWQLNVNVSDGSYGETVSVPDPIGLGTLRIIGNVTTPTNVTLSQFRILGVRKQIYLSGFNPTATSGVICYVQGAKCQIGRMHFSTGVCLAPATYGVIDCNYSTLTLDSAVTGIVSTSTGGTVLFFGANITVNGNVWGAASAFYLTGQSYVWLQSVIWTGTATGKRYAVGAFAYINVAGAGTSAIPGDVAGTVDPLGKYA